MNFEDSINQPRTWKDTSPAEIKVFLGILIYMGVHRSPRIDYYFRNDLENGPFRLLQLYINRLDLNSLNNFSIFPILKVMSSELRALKIGGIN
jgi:hypothetical protein